MNEFAERHGTRLLLALGALILAAVPFVSTGPFSIDEVIYALGAKTLATTGHLGIANGYDMFHAEALRLWLLSAGPDGLVPQYPVGSALAGAPLYAVFGIRGLIGLNAAGIVGTLFVTRALARKLYSDEGTSLLAPILLLFGTYTLEYAYGIWPHGVTVFCTVTALWLALRALDATGRAGALDAFASGLSVGIGFLFRLDSILILPVIGASVILLGRRPKLTLAWGLAGMLPGLAVASAANIVKFGSPNPLSYGPTQGGDTNVAKYIGLGTALVIALLLLIILRRFHKTIMRHHLTLAALAAAAVALTFFVVPSFRHWIEEIARGFYVLVLDIRPVHDPRLGVVRAPDGTVSFWGLYKKALGQSLPWLGILVALGARRHSKCEWRAHIILLAAAILWMLPFLPTEWHGGLGSNMRYFLPVLPMLSVLAARLWFGVLDGTSLKAREIRGWVLIGAALVLSWSYALPSGLGGAEQILTSYGLVGMTVLAATTYLPQSWRTAALARVLGQRGFLIAVGMSVVLGPVLDLALSQSRRAMAARSERQVLALPTPSIVFAPPEITADLIGRPGYLAAVPDQITDRVNAKLVVRALENGYRVFVARWLVADLLASHSGLRAATPENQTTSLPVTEIVLAAGR
ncbi:ArnT family glycosyltransferase [Solirhodobacter olei]|uniref:ArnT family glycosyltransferase n=1 Tax=Solirhodobacter olei TaxID=2493082 RepID=UPI000FDB64FC|nr:hypothetical protein [Solirhodobacter olei]